MLLPEELRLIVYFGTLSILPGVAGAAVPPTVQDSSKSTKPALTPLDTIIVTARRRQEDVQHAPLSVIALSGAKLDALSVSNLRELQRVVPNLTLAPSQNVGDASANIFIRGIGQEDFAAGTEAGVGLYVDDIYIGRTMGAMLDLIDATRVEVLRGPQGTLYGRNAVGGAINLVSRPPAGQWEGNIEAVFGSFERIETRAAINAPLSKRLSLRLAIGGTRRGGYSRRVGAPFEPTAYTEHDLRREGADSRLGARLRLRWLPHDSLTLDVSADQSRRRGAQSATHLDAVNPEAPGSNLPTINHLIRIGVLPGPEITNALVTSDLLSTSAGGGNRIAQDTGGVSLTLAKTIGGHDFRLIGAFRRLKSDVASDTDGTWFNMFSGRFLERQQQYSLEARGSGRLHGINYTLGAIAFDAKARLLPVGRVGQDVLYHCGCFYTSATRPRTLFPQRRVTDRSFGIFGESNVSLHSRLKATIGARYSLDRKTVEAKLVVLDPIELQPTAQFLATGSNRGRWDALTWRAGLQFDALQSTMLFASVARGFKSGGFNIRPALNLANLGLAGYRPETATTIEIGLRSQWLSDRLRVNATAFRTNYHDIQLRQQTIFGGIITTLVENAARARIRGLEIELEAKPLPELRLSLAYGHLDPRYRDVGKVPGLTTNSAFQRTPRNSLTAAVEYDRPLGQGMFTIHLDYGYRSREQFQLTASPWDQPGYGLLGARVAWRTKHDRWSIALFGTNLYDKRYRVGGRASLLNQTGFANSIIGMPRQIGLQLKAAY